MADVTFGWVTGTFVLPGNPVITDTPTGYSAGLVKFVPLDQPNGVVREPLLIAMDVAGSVKTELALGLWTVFTFLHDGKPIRDPFDVRVDETHTEDSPLDLTTAAPPIPSPETVVIVSEAERIRAEQAAEEAEAAAERAEAAASEIEPPFEFTQLSDLAAVTESRMGLWHYSEDATYDPPIPDWFSGNFGDYVVALTYYETRHGHAVFFPVRPWSASPTLWAEWQLYDGESNDIWYTEDTIPEPDRAGLVLGSIDTESGYAWSPREYYFTNGYGSPEGVVGGIKGMVYVDNDATEDAPFMWAKSDFGGNTGWKPVVMPGVHVQSISGNATIAAQPEYSYELTATTTASVSLTGVLGCQIAVFWSGVTGTLEGTTMNDGDFAVAVNLTAGWRVIVGGSATPPDITPPTAGTLGVVTSYTTADLTVTGATDETALHAEPFAYSKDGGTTWTAWQADPTHQFTGLATGTSFTFRHRVRDAASNVRVGTAVVKSTGTPPTRLVWAEDDFTGADGALAGRTTPTGSRPWSVDLVFGESANIVSNRLVLVGSGSHQATAKLPYPPTTATTAHVWMTVDYDVTDGVLLILIDANNNSQGVGIYLSAGALPTFWNETGANWGAQVRAVPPTVGTMVCEFWYQSDKTLSFTCTVGGVTVLQVSGTDVAWGHPPTSSQTVSLKRNAALTETNPVPIDNVLVEYDA